MEYIIVAFRSRAETIKFNHLLKANKIYCEIVNTPKQAGVGCGLSCKINPKSFEIVKNGVRVASLQSFAGFFLVKDLGITRIVKSI